MKIRGKSTQPTGINPIMFPAEAAKRISETEETHQTSDDVSVLISDKSKEISKAKEALKSIPDIRMEKVSAVRQLIDEGRYQRDSYEVAKRIVNEALLESIRKAQVRETR